MRIFIETVAGLVVLAGALVAPACLSAVRHPRALADGGVVTCATDEPPVLFCNAVTKTSPPRECVLCRARGCLTATGLYCVSSCDDVLCERRK